MKKVFGMILLGTLAAAGATPSVKIAVTDKGFVPSTIRLNSGQPTRLVFARTSANTCATAVNLPGLSKRQVELPLNKPIPVLVKPDHAGTYGFACPMKMVRGQIEVK